MKSVKVLVRSGWPIVFLALLSGFLISKFLR